MVIVTLVIAFCLNGMTIIETWQYTVQNVIKGPSSCSSNRVSTPILIPVDEPKTCQAGGNASEFILTGGETHGEF